MFAIPSLAAVMNLSVRDTSIWVGASVHGVAQVIAAALIVGPSALALEMTIKLGRVALLAPAFAVSSWRHGKQTSGQIPVLPWLVIGFIIAAALRSSEVMPPSFFSATDKVTTLALSAAMFGLGLGIRARDLWPIPFRVLILAAGATVVTAGVSLAVIAIGSA